MNKTLVRLAHPNYRGVTSDRLVYMLQDHRDKLENFAPRFDIEFDRPSTHTEEEWDEGHRLFLEETIKGLEDEIQRRRDIGVKSTNSEIIQAIKNNVKIEDILAMYTDVFLDKKVRTYRCTLHGQDKHPSGVIYPKEGRFHCFVCNKHGDVLDAVQFFEHVDLIEAIKRLARHIGLDTKPLVKTKTNNETVTREEFLQLKGHLKYLQVKMDSKANKRKPSKY